jgi:predicted DCC family thiol-disulfide oxidoreductase YuxK
LDLRTLIRRLLSAESDELPFGLLLTAKVLAVAFLVTLEPLRWASPWIGFARLPDAPTWAIWPVRLMAFLAIGAILFNVRPRLACLVLGLAEMLTVFWNQAAYENNIVFSSAVFLMIGLYERGPVFLLRWLVVICYFGAALDKALSPDWRSGAFFETWAGEILKDPGYRWLAATQPYLTVARWLSWATILTEFALMIGFAFRRTTRYAIPVALAFHLPLTLLTGNPFGLYTATMCITLLALVEWPSRGLVIYDADCGICNQTRRLFEALGDRLVWTPYQSGVGHAHGVTDDMAERAMYVVTDQRAVPAFRAFRRVLLSLPLTYMVLAALFCLAYAGYSYRLHQAGLALFVMCGLLLLVPAGLGDVAYYAVATRRHLISRVCGLPR